MDTVGIEPTTFPMRRGNHTPRPSAPLLCKHNFCHIENTCLALMVPTHLGTTLRETQTVTKMEAVISSEVASADDGGGSVFSSLSNIVPSPQSNSPSMWSLLDLPSRRHGHRTETQARLTTELRFHSELSSTSLKLRRILSLDMRMPAVTSYSSFKSSSSSFVAI